MNRDKSFTRYSADLTIGWELDFWGRFRRGIESADAAFFASLANQQDVQVLLSAQMADLYFNYCTTLQRIAIANRNAEIQRRSLEITQKIFRAGQGSELDLQQAKTQYLATLSTIPGLEANLIALRNGIAVLLGRMPGDIMELQGISGNLPMTENIAVSEVPAKLLLRRPDVRVAAWQVAAQSAQIGVAEADFYPAISLFGSLGWTQSSLGDEGDTVSLIAGPSLTWNIFDYGRIRNNVRLQDARLQQAIEAFQIKVSQAAGEIDTAAVVVVKTTEQNRFLHDSVVSAERSLVLATTRYQEGYSDFQRVLDAQRVLFSQQERELLNRGAHLSAVVDLYRALGGGWQAATAVPELVPQSTRDTMQERTNWGGIFDETLPIMPAPMLENNKTEP
ncbi:TolC family protein [Oceanicoccus sp. KOV_DT_Chl]|uniref:TolC family protein n=1 Tax=Oceanicoccus sp. KOV_DT_Chl TaxID=1904639 RepID=UPI00190EAF17|nr:TolC family protein [Oceanicoccus sp. KOV_DT_Chl]